MLTNKEKLILNTALETGSRFLEIFEEDKKIEVTPSQIYISVQIAASRVAAGRPDKWVFTRKHYGWDEDELESNLADLFLMVSLTRIFVCRKIQENPYYGICPNTELDLEDAPHKLSDATLARGLRYTTGYAYFTTYEETFSLAESLLYFAYILGYDDDELLKLVKNHNEDILARATYGDDIYEGF